MRAVRTVFRRELQALFLSPVAYVFAILILGGLGTLFVSGLGFHTRNTPDFDLQALVGSFTAFFFWFVPVPLVTAITMRLFAEEKRTGTIESLMTAPVTDLEVVMAKYLGAMAFYLILLLPTAGYFWLLELSQPERTLDWGLVASAYLGMAILGALFTAVGCLASALSTNQGVAAILCFSTLSFLILAPMLLLSSALEGEGLRAALAYLNLMPAGPNSLLGAFGQGFVTLGHIAYPVSGAACCLFLTWKVMASRSWR